MHIVIFFYFVSTYVPYVFYTDNVHVPIGLDDSKIYYYYSDTGLHITYAKPVSK